MGHTSPARDQYPQRGKRGGPVAGHRALVSPVRRWHLVGLDRQPARSRYIVPDHPAHHDSLFIGGGRFHKHSLTRPPFLLIILSPHWKDVLSYGLRKGIQGHAVGLRGGHRGSGW